MNMSDVLSSMRKETMGTSFQEYLQSMYERDTQNILKSIEEDYLEAKSFFAQGCGEALHTALQQMEANNEHARKSAAQSGFSIGLYHAFKQHFDKAYAAHLSVESALQKSAGDAPDALMPRDMADRCADDLSFEGTLHEELNKEMRDHLVSIECAWEQRIHSAALHGFYLGYRAAYEIIDTICPLSRIEARMKTFALEHELGLTSSFDEILRNEMNSKLI